MITAIIVIGAFAFLASLPNILEAMVWRIDNLREARLKRLPQRALEGCECEDCATHMAHFGPRGQRIVKRERA